MKRISSIFLYATSALLLLSPSILFLVTACQWQSAFDSPEGQALTQTAGALMVARVIENNPSTRPAFATLANGLADENGQASPEKMLAGYGKPEQALVMQTLGLLSAHYGKDGTPKVLANAIHAGLAFSEPATTTGSK